MAPGLITGRHPTREHQGRALSAGASLEGTTGERTSKVPALDEALTLLPGESKACGHPRGLGASWPPGVAQLS
jgi:hypothetical protein